MDDMHALAELSHAVERSALALAAHGFEVPLIADELQTVGAGQREAVALALAYLLRRRAEVRDPGESPLGGAIEAVALTLRRM